MKKLILTTLLLLSINCSLIANAQVTKLSAPPGLKVVCPGQKECVPFSELVQALDCLYTHRGAMYQICIDNRGGKTCRYWLTTYNFDAIQGGRPLFTFQAPIQKVKAYSTCAIYQGGQFTCASKFLQPKEHKAPWRF